MRSSDIRNRCRLRTDDIRQEMNFPAVVHPHLKNPRLRLLFHAKCGERNADMIIEIFKVTDGPVSGRKDPVHHILRGCFPDASGDRHPDQIQAGDIIFCHHLHRLQRIFRKNHRCVSMIFPQVKRHCLRGQQKYPAPVSICRGCEIVPVIFLPRKSDKDAPLPCQSGIPFHCHSNIVRRTAEQYAARI